MRTVPAPRPVTSHCPAAIRRLLGHLTRLSRGTAAAGCVLLALYAPGCPAATGEAARADFLAAERALESGDLARFHALRAQLGDYPLVPYLDAAALRTRLDQADPAEVRALLDEIADVPIASDLRRHWLASLARRGEWALVRAAWRPGLGPTADCLHARALFATGSTEAVPVARALWLHGASRPAQCDPVFEDLAGSGALSADLVWQRFELAMQAGQDGLARHLLARLTGTPRAAAQTWLALRANPTALDVPDALAGTGPHAPGILTDVLRRQARADPLTTAARWERWRDALPLSAAQAGQIDRALAVMLAVDREPLAGRYFERLPASAYDDTTHEWRARHALGQGDWQGLADAIAAMPAALAAKARWQYWRGRALEELGDSGAATAAYRGAAGEREFHGFLAAEKLGLPPALNPRPTPEDPAVQARLAALPGVARARELDALGRRLPARREWDHALRDQDRAALVQATLLAHRWGWRADAIALATRAGLWDDLEVRFPLAFGADIARAARASGLDPALIAGVMRRESALNPQARSHADARGLMQLLPATARRVARQLGEPWDVRGLYDPATNIRYGSQYLADQLVRFGGHRALAAAAYNAGPHRVVRWLGPGAQPADVWIELIPFGETRDYVSAVLAYAVIYATRAGQDPPPLSAWLAPIPAAETLARCDPAGAC